MVTEKEFIKSLADGSCVLTRIATESAELLMKDNFNNIGVVTGRIPGKNENFWITAISIDNNIIRTPFMRVHLDTKLPEAVIVGINSTVESARCVHNITIQNGG